LFVTDFGMKAFCFWRWFCFSRLLLRGTLFDVV
jgi:hypothetical protein